MNKVARVVACAALAPAIWMTAGWADTAPSSNSAALPGRGGTLSGKDMLDPAIKNRLAAAVRGRRLRVGHFSGSYPNASTSGIASLAISSYGWNYEHVSYYYGFNSGGVDYVNLYFTDGSYIVTNDPILESAAGAICISSPIIGFYVTYISGEFFEYEDFIVEHT